MIEREHEDRVVARELRKEPEPPAPVRAGSREWASAVGSAAVARMARERMVAREADEQGELGGEPAGAPGGGGGRRRGRGEGKPRGGPGRAPRGRGRRGDP